MKKFNITDMLISVVIAELVGAVSALLSGNFSGFYKTIERPAFSPPAAVFPAVWTILYALMGISAYLIHLEESDFGAKKSTAMGLYVIQLAVNFSWSIIFFRFRLFTAAAAIAVLLAVLVAAMVIAFSKVRKTAALMNLPYLAWSIFAAYLAIGVCIKN